jgi:peroxiredoxin
MVALGSPLPSFSLPDTTTGKTIDSTSLAGRPAVVIFICNHCPFVKHIRAGLADFGRFCRDRQVGMVAISANDVTTHPDDAPPAMAAEAARSGFVFPYLYDESQAVARAFDARCTPDLFVFAADGTLAYRGQFDDARPGNGIPVTGRDARAAVAALLAGQRPTAAQLPSIGCSIKWRPGNEPV